MDINVQRVIGYSEVIVVDNYQRHNQLKEDILPYLLISPDKQNKKTNVKAKMTDWTITSSEIEILKESVIKCMIEVDPQIEWKPVFFHNFWGNVYEKGDYTISHDHLPSSYSFVYFLKSKPNYSPLVLGDCFWGSKSIKPKEGRFVVFPSSLNHLVKKHKYRDTRVTLSGNLTLK